MENQSPVQRIWELGKDEHGRLSAETFITVVILALGMSAPIVAAFNFVDTLAQVGTTVGQVDEILKAEEQLHAETPVSFNGYDIDVKDVSFGYHEGEEILHDISVTLPDKTTTAIIGPSGSGKTTFCNLIARFWDVDSGSVKIDGQDVREYTLESLMDQISVVFQNVYLFAENRAPRGSDTCDRLRRNSPARHARRAYLPARHLRRFRRREEVSRRLEAVSTGTIRQEQQGDAEKSGVSRYFILYLPRCCSIIPYTAAAAAGRRAAI